MTLQEIAQAWKDRSTVWCIFDRNIHESAISRIDVSFDTFHNKYVCERLEVIINNREVDTHPFDLFHTQEEAKAELLKRKNNPALSDIVSASVKIGEAIHILSFYTDESTRAAIDKLIQADEELNIIQSHIKWRQRYIR